MMIGMPRVALLLTGNELMTGDIVDSNSAMIAEQLLDQGLSVQYKVTVGDDLLLLQDEIKRLSEQFDILIVNGGLGPTSDDLTAEALALASSLELAEHPRARAHLESICREIGMPLSPANLKQALLPKDCRVIPNPVGSAVGFSMRLMACEVFCTPGVPHELKCMLEQEILPLISTQLDEAQKPVRTRLKVFGYGESALQQILSDQFPDWPEEIEIGFRASMPMLELKLQTRSAHQTLLQSWTERVRRLLGAHVISETEMSMQEALVAQLHKAGKKVTFAESCTGGLVASLLTQVSGASRVFEAGYVSYANDIKQQMLGVSAQSLEAHGAVSEPVVREMLTGALERSAADLGVAVSGVAGPEGGTPDKPVGAVWLAWGTHQKVKTALLKIPGTRKRFQLLTATIAMDLIRRELLAIETPPNYLIERALNKSKPGT